MPSPRRERQASDDPRPGGVRPRDSISKVPPTSAARSRMAVRPTPLGVPGRMPTPSSSTSTSRASPSRIRTSQWVAAPWRGVGERLERDPVRGRLDRRGQRRERVRTLDPQVEALVPGGDPARPGPATPAAGRARRGPAAAGRGTGAGPPRAGRPGRVELGQEPDRCRPGRRSPRARAASTFRRAPAIDGPRPSCRSRRSRRRSSSRAGDELPARSLELGDEPDRASRAPGLVGQAGEQPPIGLG
jgi:hypothetical protein